MNRALNHMPYDNGAVADAFDQMFGPFTWAHKTTKTRCGQRVPLAWAQHKQPVTCAACLEDLRREEDGLRKVREYAERLTAAGTART